MEFLSPLRYPGGKAKVADFVQCLIKENALLDGTYVEPYVGGGSVALSLLFNEYVRDIYINDKKCAGILTESQINTKNNTLDYAVIGMGINVLPPENGFDIEIADIATSIFEKDAPCGYKQTLLNEIFDTFFDYYKDIEKKTYLKSYKESSNIIGKEVDVYYGNEIIRGTAIDIDDMAHLIVKTSEEVRVFGSGEARVRQEGKPL